MVSPTLCATVRKTLQDVVVGLAPAIACEALPEQQPECHSEANDVIELSKTSLQHGGTHCE
jgi:hypothetical protein